MDSELSTSASTLLYKNGTQLQPFHCSICFRGFSYKDWDILDETNRNFNERICPICKKSFYDAGTMRRHLKVHQSCRELYVCNICSKSFTRKDNLNVHMKTIHMVI
ncbi:unnamed protein product [Larinioides sclopetarius]|uniref:C2H2-type domain-containing protein n=1 Tax=Larinioides sclopetarius TaxID=280406 RepID=A0AAV2BXU3_9ARAC